MKTITVPQILELLNFFDEKEVMFDLTHSNNEHVVKACRDFVGRLEKDKGFSSAFAMVVTFLTSQFMEKTISFSNVPEEYMAQFVFLQPMIEKYQEYMKAQNPNI